SLPYCRLLGYRKESAGIMGNLASKSSLPFIVSFKDRDKYKLDCVNRILDIENASSNLYSLIIKNRGESNTEMAFSPVKV
ncbi:MAG: nucleotidyltransferase family protein, partial [Clostridia bacterium]|nr:nucleotidyltransferase family protein [Clostridia bacterium]